MELVPAAGDDGIWIWQFTIPGWKDLDRTGLELGDLGLGIEDVVGEDVGGGLGEVHGDENDADGSLIGDGGAQDNFAAAEVTRTAMPSVMPCISASAGLIWRRASG